jgi:TRAP-type C4-dicarboxylate transport system substrate-binding protein
MTRTHARRRAMRTVPALASAGALLLTAGCAAGGEEKPRIVVADTFPTHHVISETGTQEFVSALTEGEEAPFEVEYYPGGQLGETGDLVSLSRTGAIDVTNVIPAYMPDFVPLTTVSDLPNIPATPCEASRSLMSLVEPGGILYEEEFEARGLHPLWVATVTEYEIYTARTPVEEPEDLHGLSIRSSGGSMDLTLDGLGASGVGIPTAETYEALSRHTIDGAALPPSSLLSYRLEEVVDYSTEGIQAGAGAIVYTMSADAWDSLTPEQQDRVTEAGRSTGQSVCAGIEKEADAAAEAIRAAGVESVELTAEQREAFAGRMEPIKDDWAKGLDAVGKPGSEVLHAYEEAVARETAASAGTEGED